MLERQLDFEYTDMEVNEILWLYSGVSGVLYRFQICFFFRMGLKNLSHQKIICQLIKHVEKVKNPRKRNQSPKIFCKIFKDILYKMIKL